jgi:methylmalonyl-CoA mutase
MINEIVAACDVDLSRQDVPSIDALTDAAAASTRGHGHSLLARLITALEADAVPAKTRETLLKRAGDVATPVLGITGTGGAGKSSLTDELVRRFRFDQDDRLRIAILSIDPSRRKSGGALLGDRIRMNAIQHDNIYMRSLATRDTGTEISKALPDAIAACKVAGFDLIVVETSGIGQGDAAIVPHVDLSLYVMTPEFGAASQLEKIDMLDFADFVAINKFDRKGAKDALRDVRKQYQRNRELFGKSPDDMPVYGTIAARFADDGVTALYHALKAALTGCGMKLADGRLPPALPHKASTDRHVLIPSSRVRYLADIADTVRGYHGWALQQSRAARERQQLREAKRLLFHGREAADGGDDEALARRFDSALDEIDAKLDPRSRKLLAMWPKTVESYAGDEYVVKIRDRELRTKLTTTTLSGTKIPKVVLPRFEDEGEIL